MLWLKLCISNGYLSVRSRSFPVQYMQEKIIHSYWKLLLSFYFIFESSPVYFVFFAMVLQSVPNLLKAHALSRQSYSGMAITEM